MSCPEEVSHKAGPSGRMGRPAAVAIPAKEAGAAVQESCSARCEEKPDDVVSHRAAPVRGLGALQPSPHSLSLLF